MSAIPLHDLDEVATKADIALIRSEMAEMRAELKLEIATEVGALRKSLTAWMLTLLVAIIGAMASIGFIA